MEIIKNGEFTKIYNTECKEGSLEHYLFVKGVPSRFIAGTVWRRPDSIFSYKGNSRDL